MIEYNNKIYLTMQALTDILFLFGRRVYLDNNVYSHGFILLCLSYRYTYRGT